MLKIALEFLEKAKSVTKALLTGEDVSPERLERRLEICSTCDKVMVDEYGNMKCGICGCSMAGDRRLMNLARYIETPSYGCKHPEGSKWEKNGV